MHYQKAKFVPLLKEKKEEKNKPYNYKKNSAHLATDL